MSKAGEMLRLDSDCCFSRNALRARLPQLPVPLRNLGQVCPLLRSSARHNVQFSQLLVLKREQQVVRAEGVGGRLCLTSPGRSWSAVAPTHRCQPASATLPYIPAASKCESTVSTSYDTIGELSSLLAANGDEQELPSEFVVPDSCRPTVPFDASSENPLPVLDLSQGAVDHPGGLAGKLTEICEEWGFVQVINHAVPSSIIQEMASFGHSFFELPTEHKMKVAFSYLNGYGAKQINLRGVGTPWVEGLTLRTSPESNIDAFEAKMWPNEGNAALRQTLEQFAFALQKLEIRLLQLLAQGLGLETTLFSQHFEKGLDLTTGMHFNYYPPCPDPSKVLGALPHTDPSCFTVLFQDRITGLQLQAKDGSWHPVQHREDGLLVFVGDILQGWSNGRFPAVVHQVVLNNKIPRLSFLHATSPAADFVIQPAPAGGDRQRYKPFTYKGYMEFKSDLHLQTPDDKQKPIEVFAGID